MAVCSKKRNRSSCIPGGCACDGRGAHTARAQPQISAACSRARNCGGNLRIIPFVWYVNGAVFLVDREMMVS